jgi:hypothetical protein
VLVELDVDDGVAGPDLGEQVGETSEASGPTTRSM